MLDRTQTSLGAAHNGNGFVSALQEDDGYQNLGLGNLDCLEELLKMTSGNHSASSSPCDKRKEIEMGRKTASSRSLCADGCVQAKSNAAVYAAEHGMLDILRVLLVEGVTTGTEGKVCSTPLHRACERGDLTMVEMILTKIGVQHIDGLDCAQLTPLYYAVKGGSLDVVKLLVQQGAHVNLPFPREMGKAQLGLGGLS